MIIDEIKNRLLIEAQCAAKYDNTEKCIGILKALHDTTADARVFKLINEVRKEIEK